MGLFDEQISRKPDLYPWTRTFIEALHGSFWTDKEFSFSSDVQDFKVYLNEAEREMIVKSLSTIGQLEISVKKFWSKLGDNLPHPSINDLGYVMANTEVIHGNAYERLLEVLGLEEAFDDILKLDIIKGRVQYLKKHLHKFHSDNKKQFIYSLILFTLFVENIALFSQFYTILWFRKFKNDCLKNTTKQVEYTSREEYLHAFVGIRIINELRVEYPELFDEDLENKICHEAEQAVKYECEIIKWIVGDFHHENLNCYLLKQFIENRMNSSLNDIGYKSIFEVDQDELKKTSWFNEEIIGEGMTDFFANRASEYSMKDQSFNEEDLF